MDRFSASALSVLVGFGLIVLRLADVAGSPRVSMAVGAALVVAPLAARRRGGGRHGDPERGRPLTINESQRHAHRLRAGRLLLGRVGDLRLRRRPRLRREPVRLAWCRAADLALAAGSWPEPGNERR